jgi:hypothetical protein
MFQLAMELITGVYPGFKPSTLGQLQRIFNGSSTVQLGRAASSRPKISGCLLRPGDAAFAKDFTKNIHQGCPKNHGKLGPRNDATRTWRKTHEIIEMSYSLLKSDPIHIRFIFMVFSAFVTIFSWQNPATKQGCWAPLTRMQGIVHHLKSLGCFTNRLGHVNENITG